MRLHSNVARSKLRGPLAVLFTIFTVSAAAVGVLALAPAAMASTAYVQSASGSASGASLEVSYTTNVQAGDLLVGKFRANGTTSVSDSVNGAWTKAASTTSEGVTHSVWYRQNAAAGKTKVTVSGATSGSLRAVLGEYSGVATSGALDQTSCNQGTTTSVTTGATASVGAGDLLFAGVGAFEHPITVTAGSSDGVSATLRTQFSGEHGTSAEEDVTSSASGAQNASFTLSEATPSGWAACAAAFHPLGAPENTALPVVSGTAQQGSALSTTNGTWTNSPTSFSYAWKDCNLSGESCTTISGATSSSYTLKEADVGHTIRSVVTATNAGGSTSATSAATSPVQSEETTAPACTKYANSATGSDTNAGTKEKPYKTLKKLVTSLGAGQVGCLQAGQNFANEPNSTGNGILELETTVGKAGQPVTITSTSATEPAIINHPVTLHTGADYYTFTHLIFKWKEPTPHGCWSKEGNLIPGKVIHEPLNGTCEAGTKNPEDAVQLVISGKHDTFTYDDVNAEHSTICMAVESEGTHIENSRVHGCGPPVIRTAEGGFPVLDEEPGWHDHGIYDNGTSGVFKNNYIYESSRNGVLFYKVGKGSVVEHNVIDGNGNGIAYGTNTNETARWNIITNSTSPRKELSFGISQFEPGKENVAEHNDVSGNEEANINAPGVTLKENEEKAPEYVNAGKHEYESPLNASGYGPTSPPTKY
jgi:hypothetical protein